MKNIISKIYTVLLIISFIFCIYVLVSFKQDATCRHTLGGYVRLSDCVAKTYSDPNAPCGIREEYEFSFDEVEGSYRDLVFYTIHQKVDVYVGQGRIYRLRPYVNNDFGKTPGCVWNRVALENTEKNSTVRVVIYPVYKSSIGTVPKFYYGEEHDIAMAVLSAQLPVLVVCLICFMLGLLFAIFSTYNYRNTDSGISLAMLGVFAVVISLWKLSDNEAVYLLYPYLQGIYLVPFIMLHLTSTPFIMFVRELNAGNRGSKIWHIPIIVNFVGFISCLILQLINILDMRQLLWVVHLELVISSFVVFFMLYREIHERGMNPKLRQNLFFLLLCVSGMAVDLIVYYTTDGMVGTLVGMLCFIVYICVLGTNSIKDARALMDFGLQAKTFEQKAYHDQLTGLNNRTAYADYTGREGFSAEHCIIAVFDLNNLKKCNDTLGHEKGDIYIKECAHIIKETFSDVGTCYRMGGDEFCAILENVSLDVCKKRMERLQEMVAERNRNHPEIEMGIACGYEMFDKRIDYDINDTSRRADKMMYHEKYTMKQQKAESV